MPAGDSRKEFLLATAGNFFGVSVSDGSISHAHDSAALNSFLDDGSVSVLAASQPGGVGKVEFSNKVHMLKYWSYFSHQISVHLTRPICLILN